MVWRGTAYGTKFDYCLTSLDVIIHNNMHPYMEIKRQPKIMWGLEIDSSHFENLHDLTVLEWKIIMSRTDLWLDRKSDPFHSTCALLYATCVLGSFKCTMRTLNFMQLGTAWAFLCLYVTYDTIFPPKNFKN